MQCSTIRFTIVFEESFWVGYYERRENGYIAVARHIFGPEPTGPQLAEIMCRDFIRQLIFSPQVPDTRKKTTGNPKRMQRQINAQRKKEAGISKAKDIVKEAIKQSHSARKKRRRHRLQKIADEQFRLKQLKKKTKRKGH
jgi:hypothetical protein